MEASGDHLMPSVSWDRLKHCTMKPVAGPGRCYKGRNRPLDLCRVGDNDPTDVGYDARVTPLHHQAVFQMSVGIGEEY